MGVGKHVVEMSEQEQERAINLARELAPEFDKRGAQADQENQFPFDLVAPYKEAGLPGIGVPKRFGGGGADIWTLARVSFELAKGDPSIALAFNWPVPASGTRSVVQGLPVDSRDYGAGAQILRALGVREIRLMTNNPAKHRALAEHGLRIADRIPIIVPPNPDNIRYLTTKRARMEHTLGTTQPESPQLRRTDEVS